MARLGWGKKAITEGCINDWYKDRPVGRMVKEMRDNHRLLAQEVGGGKYKDSIVAYDRTKFMSILNLPVPDLEANPTERYIELAVAVSYYQGIEKYHEYTTGKQFPLCWSCYPSIEAIITAKQPHLKMLYSKEEVDNACDLCGEDWSKPRVIMVVPKETHAK